MDLVVANAGGANANPPRGAIDDRANALQVDVPAPVGHIVGVTDLMPELRATPTYIAYFCHSVILSKLRG